MSPKPIEEVKEMNSKENDILLNKDEQIDDENRFYKMELGKFYLVLCI